MKDAIQKAIEGGYEENGWVKALRTNTLKGHDIYHIKHIEAFILLDPLFWQALGKAMGWGVMQIDGQDVRVGRDGYIHVWQCEWHRFIDHLAEGKHAEEFFTNLLK